MVYGNLSTLDVMAIALLVLLYSEAVLGILGYLFFTHLLWIWAYQRSYLFYDAPAFSLFWSHVGWEILLLEPRTRNIRQF